VIMYYKPIVKHKTKTNDTILPDSIVG